jgi:hypothetical protein
VLGGGPKYGILRKNPGDLAIRRYQVIRAQFHTDVRQAFRFVNISSTVSSYIATTAGLMQGYLFTAARARPVFNVVSRYFDQPTRERSDVRVGLSCVLRNDATGAKQQVANRTKQAISISISTVDPGVDGVTLLRLTGKNFYWRVGELNFQRRRRTKNATTISTS